MRCFYSRLSRRLPETNTRLSVIPTRRLCWEYFIRDSDLGTLERIPCLKQRALFEKKLRLVRIATRLKSFFFLIVCWGKAILGVRLVKRVVMEEIYTWYYVLPDTFLNGLFQKGLISFSERKMVFNLTLFSLIRGTVESMCSRMVCHVSQYTVGSGKCTLVARIQLCYQTLLSCPRCNCWVMHLPPTK